MGCICPQFKQKTGRAGCSYSCRRAEQSRVRLAAGAHTAVTQNIEQELSRNTALCNVHADEFFQELGLPAATLLLLNTVPVLFLYFIPSMVKYYCILPNPGEQTGTAHMKSLCIFRPIFAILELGTFTLYDITLGLAGHKLTVKHSCGQLAFGAQLQ